MIKLRNSQEGVTLIECLIVAAIIGILSATLIPNLLDALQKANQKRTTTDMRNIGSAWLSWLTDQVGSAAAGSSKVYKTTDFDCKSYAQIFDYLRPSDTFFYMQEVPQLDGWRREFVYGQNSNLLLSSVIAIWAPCRDNIFANTYGEGKSYSVEAFLSTDYDHDIIWADGYFVQWPEGTKR